MTTLPGRRQGRALAPWVWTIALRVALDSRRLQSATRPEIGDAGFPDAARDPELADAIRSLPSRRRLIVFLRYFADFSYAEIAETCQVSDDTVAATLAHAHYALRAVLATERVEGARR